MSLLSIRVLILINSNHKQSPISEETQTKTINKTSPILTAPKFNSDNEYRGDMMIMREGHVE